MRCKCKEICESDERFKSFQGPNLSYEFGFKKCTVCEKSIKTDHIKCECCNNRLRNKRRR